MNYLILLATHYALLAWGLTGGLSFIIVIGLYFIFNPEKFQKWASMFAWLGTRIWDKWKYFAIKNEIEGDINSFVSRLEAKTKIPFPRVKILWSTKSSEDEIIWEDSEAIIVMRDRKHRKKNVVHAVYFFTSEAMLKKSKRHLSKSQKTSIDLFATLKILQAESAAAVEQFMNDYFSPIIAKSDDIRQYVKQYTSIDRAGIFFAILIHELSSLGTKVFLEKPTAEVINEVKALISFLEVFSERETGTPNTQDTFVGQYTRCAIKVVSSVQIRQTGNIFPHKNRILTAVKNKLENIYVIGRSDDGNQEFMRDVVNSVIAEVAEIELAGEVNLPTKIKVRGGRFRSVSTCLIRLHNASAVKYLYSKEDTQLAHS